MGMNKPTNRASPALCFFFFRRFFPLRNHVGLEKPGSTRALCCQRRGPSFNWGEGAPDPLYLPSEGRRSGKKVSCVTKPTLPSVKGVRYHGCRSSVLSVA